jgi:bifunctional UDP-N-acetylglucosamine pyrophosphorylase/glucosamine-1-phosphate N-acetyltransferase
VGKLDAVILAAGLGKRMKSRLPKILHRVGGRPMIWYPVHLARRVADSTVAIVIGHGAQKVGDYLTCEKKSLGPFRLVEQTEQRGTGHAVQQAMKVLTRGRNGATARCLILNGDTPLLTESTVRSLLDRHARERATVTFLTGILDDPRGYGRVIRGSQGEVLKVVEDRDASMEELAIHEVNSGMYVVESSFLFKALKSLDPHNSQSELYLTDIIHMASEQGLRVTAMAAPETKETIGINTREDLAMAEKHMRQRICRKWMRQGVTFLDPDRTRIDEEVIIGQDTLLYPDVSLEGHTELGESCIIHSQTRITDSIMGEGVVVKDCCVLEGVKIDSESAIGPFAHLRRGTRIGPQAKVGNFVELKQAELGKGSKANHLSYLGDAIIGQGVNIGAGTITCNYDGYRKEQTVIEDQVFIGSDTQLIAPVRIGRGAIVAAGTTVTHDIPPNALGISRTTQVNKEGAASRRRAIRKTLVSPLRVKRVRSRTKGAKTRSPKTRSQK